MTRPEELAGLLIAAVLVSTIVIDFVVANPLGLAWWDALVTMTAIGITLGGVLVFAMFLPTAFLVMGSVYLEDRRGAIALLVSVGLSLVILTLSTGPKPVFRQTTATVLAAVFIALVIGRNESWRPADDGEE